MQTVAKWVVLVAICGVCSQVRGAITLISFETQAQANAYAPLDSSEYFINDDKLGISPAVCDVSADWMGTNVGGTTNTWHMLSAAHVSSATTLTPTKLTVTGAASFSYRTITTADFVDPNSVALQYGPGAGGGYGTQFTIDTPCTYTIVAHLLRFASVTLSSSSTNIFQRSNFSSTLVSVSVSGQLPPGQYQFGTGANLYGGVSNGIHDTTYAGSVLDFSLVIQTPELSYILISSLLILAISTRNRLCHGSFIFSPK